MCMRIHLEHPQPHASARDTLIGRSPSLSACEYDCGKIGSVSKGASGQVVVWRHEERSECSFNRARARVIGRQLQRGRARELELEMDSESGRLVRVCDKQAQLLNYAESVH